MNRFFDLAALLAIAATARKAERTGLNSQPRILSQPASLTQYFL
jgi:hypothetical protein